MVQTCKSRCPKTPDESWWFACRLCRWCLDYRYPILDPHMRVLQIFFEVQCLVGGRHMKHFGCDGVHKAIRWLLQSPAFGFENSQKRYGDGRPWLNLSIPKLAWSRSILLFLEMLRWNDRIHSNSIFGSNESIFFLPNSTRCTVTFFPHSAVEFSCGSAFRLRGRAFEHFPKKHETNMKLI